MKKIILLLVIFSFVFGLIEFASASNPGAIWTTYSGCGDIKQDVNHYAIGDHVYINGAGFNPGTYSWFIIGKPGHASADPKIKVAQGEVITDSLGAFCFDAYTVASDDAGEYGVTVNGVKSDNYRVIKADYTCEEAIDKRLLTAVIDGGEVFVQNDASKNFKVSLVSYQMYSGNVFDQTPFDWTSALIPARHDKTLNVDVPGCAYQIDLVCGEPLLSNPEYGDSVIAFEFQNEGDHCTQSDASSGPGVSAELSVAPYYPQGNNYSFVCNATGFTPTSYSWYYGDGQLLVNSALTDVFHTYANSGTYTAACRATDGINWAVDTLDVNVN